MGAAINGPVILSRSRLMIQAFSWRMLDLLAVFSCLKVALHQNQRPVIPENHDHEIIADLFPDIDFNNAASCR